MVADRGDWCIRAEGLGCPIPIFYCEDCGQEIVTDETIEKVRQIFKEEGSDAWFARSAEECCRKALPVNAAAAGSEGN